MNSYDGAAQPLASKREEVKEERATERVPMTVLSHKCSGLRMRTFIKREKMWIRQIVIHGFKSYAERTEIGEFDQQFNAITGLNGSGKSNILDSICFVLGISNLSQVSDINNSTP